MNLFIKVFKTNIDDERIAARILKNLSSILPYCHINFDLSDCDNVLRIVAAHPRDVDTLVSYVKREGFLIAVLD